MTEKACTKCKETKPVDQFGNNKRSKDGLTSQCKTCRREADRKWYEANKERKAETNRKWREANPERKAEYDRKWLQANKEHRAEYDRKYRDANKEHRAEYGRKWYEENKEQYAETRRKWQQANPDKVRAARHRRRARKECAVPQRWVKSECPDTNCYWCGVDLSTAETHLEHLMPLSLGGPAISLNEAPACARCNQTKGDKHPLVWIAAQF